jgi:hypothetical protein
MPRINHEFIDRLRQALEALSIPMDSVPIEVLMSPWHEQRRYFEEALGLGYCIRCKLPIPVTQIAPDVTSMCIGHRATQLGAWDDYRRNVFTGIRNRPDSSPQGRNRYYRRQLNQRARDRWRAPIGSIPSTLRAGPQSAPGPSGPSTTEPPTGPAVGPRGSEQDVMDILNKAREPVGPKKPTNE